MLHLLNHHKVIKGVSEELLANLKKTTNSEKIKCFYVLETPSKYEYYDYSSEDKISSRENPVLRVLSKIEIAELFLSYTGLAFKNHPSLLEKAMLDTDSETPAESNTIYAWIKEGNNTGAAPTHQYFLKLIRQDSYNGNKNGINEENCCEEICEEEEKSMSKKIAGNNNMLVRRSGIKSTFCRWPCCLSVSSFQLHLDSGMVSALPENLSNLMVIPIGLAKCMIQTFTATNPLELLLLTLSIYKSKYGTKQMEGSTRKSHLEHYCPLHKTMAAALAISHRINLYSLDKCKDFNDVLYKKEKKVATSNTLVSKIQQG